MIAAGHVLTPMRIGRWFLCIAGLVVALMIGVINDKTHLPNDTHDKTHVVKDKAVDGRKVYPLSVIAGGAYSVEELNRVRRLDSVVKAHYDGFGENATVQQAPKDLLVYVSYRKSNTVYWTKTKRRVPKGEFLLSDGKNLARTRCGNRLSFTPQQPTNQEQEPTEEVLNTPETPEIEMPFTAPIPPNVEADLYVPSDSLPMDLLSPSPSLAPPAALQPNLSSAAGGAYAPVSGWGMGALGGGVPFGVARSGLPTGTNTNSGTTPAAIKGLIIVNTPEPGSAQLLLLPALFFIFLCWRGKIHLS